MWFLGSHFAHVSYNFFKGFLFTFFFLSISLLFSLLRFFFSLLFGSFFLYFVCPCFSMFSFSLCPCSLSIYFLRLFFLHLTFSSSFTSPARHSPLLPCSSASQHSPALLSLPNGKHVVQARRNQPNTDNFCWKVENSNPTRWKQFVNTKSVPWEAFPLLIAVFYMAT